VSETKKNGEFELVEKDVGGEIILVDEKNPTFDENMVDVNPIAKSNNLLLNQEESSSVMVQAPVDAHAQIMNVVLNVDEYAWRKSSSAAARAGEKKQQQRQQEKVSSEVVTPDEEVIVGDSAGQADGSVSLRP
jgi:hypothetical protein